MKKFTLWLVMLFVFTLGQAQTVLINPNQEGGFELPGGIAGNGWTTVNPSTDTWQIGSLASPGASNGTNSAFVSNNGGTTWAYSQTSVFNHIYRDITIPAGEPKLTISFDWKAGGEGGTTSDWDNLKVYLAPITLVPSSTASNPSVNQISGAGATLGMYKLSSASWNSETIITGVVPGQSYRLIFQWKSDITDIVNPPAAVDKIIATSSTAGNFISVATGNWSSPSTWDANQVPSSADNVIISPADQVTINLANQGANNVQVLGQLKYGTTPTQFNVNGNLTVDNSGSIEVFNGTTGKTLVVRGNLTNNGTINLSIASANLTLNGNTIQTIEGTGSFTSNVITNLTFSNTSTATPNIEWNLANIKVANNLSLSNGRIDLNNNKITFGNNASGGTLTAPVGTGFMDGTFAFWWTATATGTSITAGSDPTNSTSRYPFISSTGAQRAFYITRTGTTTGNVAGEVAIDYSDVAGTTSNLTLNDGGYTVTNRSNSNWTVTTGPGYVHNGAYTLVGLANGMYNAANGNSRLVYANGSLTGTHQNGTSTPGAQRINVTNASMIAEPIYIGTNEADIQVTSIASGDWNATTTWSNGQVPTCTSNLLITAGTTVTVNSAGNLANSVAIASGGTLVSASGDLTVGCVDKKHLFSNSGTYTMNGGTLTVNGQFVHNTGSTFNQTAGDIVVDGNNAAIAASSVPANNAIVQVSTNLLNWTGGTLTIVDPHANSTTTNTFSYSSSSNVNIVGNHIFRLGNGISTDTTANTTSGFRLNTYVGAGRITFANLEINGSAAPRRYVTSVYGFGVNNDFTITANGEFQSGSNNYYFAGNVVNNGKLVMSSTMQLATFLNGTAAAATNAQTVSGTGIFTNALTAGTASIANLTVNNTNTAGVTLSVPLSVSGALTLTSGIVNTSLTSVLTVGTTTSAGTISGGSQTAYVSGPIARTIATGNTSFIQFPVGKVAYAPIWVNPATTTVAVVRAEAFNSNTGTANASIVSLTNLRRWEAPLISGTATSFLVRIGDTNLVATNIPVQALTANGEYTNTFGSTSTFTAGTLETVQSILPVAAANYTGFISYAVSNICDGTPNPGATTSTASTICLGQSITLGMANVVPGTGVTYEWQSSTNGTTYTAVPSQTSFTFTTTPASELYYRCNVTCATSGISTISTPFQVSFSNEVLTTTPGVKCGPGSSEIAATGNAGATIKWYVNATGGASIGSGSPFVTPTISSDTAFYAAAEIPSPVVSTLGAGATTSSIVGESFLPGAWGGAKTQYIIRPSELNASGIFAGPITSLGFEPTNSGQTYQGFTVQIGNSVANTAPTGAFLTGLTTVYQGTETDNGFTPVANAVNTLAFGTGTASASSFNWDGVSNIVVSITWSRVPATNTATSTTMKVDNVGYAVSAYRQRDNLTPADMLAEASVSATSQFRPRFTINGTGVCSSPRVMVPIDFTPAPALTLSGASAAICEGQTTAAVTLTSTEADFNSYVWTPSTGVTGSAATGWTFNPSTTTTYTLNAQSASNCQNVASYVVNVTNVVAPAALAGASACVGSTSKTITAASVQLAQTPIVVPFNITAQPVEVNAAPGNVLATATMPTLPTGAVITGATLSVPNITANSNSWQSEVRLGLAGALVNSAAAGTGSIGAPGTFNYTRTFTPTTGTGSTIDILYWDNSNDITAGPDATFTLGAATLTINYTIPSGITWWTAATGGTQLGATNTIDAIGTSVLPSPAAAGTYTFYAQTETGTCASFNRTPLVVTINALPTPAITASNPVLCNGSSIFLISSSATGNVWSTSATATNDSISVNAAGSYTVTVTDANGCVGTSAPYVTTITALPVVSAGTDQTVCANSNVTLVGSGAPTLTWNNNVTNNTPFVATATNSYIVTGTAANGCVNRDTVTVTVNALPVPVITGDLAICAGDSTLLVTSSATGNVWSTTATNDSIYVSTAGSYIVTETDANGCVGTSAPVVVVVNALPSVNAGNDIAVCQNGQAILFATGAPTLTWNNNVSNGVSFIATASNTYIVTGTDANGCVDKDTLVLTVNALPIVDGGDNVTLCGVGQVTLTATGASVYSWSNGITNGVPFTAEVGSNSYLVTGIDANGCSNTDIVMVTVNNVPVATATAANQLTIVASPAGMSYQWVDCATNTPILGANNQTFTATANGSYKVIVTGMGGCADTSACVNINSVGLENNQADLGISLYPNPTTGNVFVNMPATEEATITVFDAQGKVVMTLENAQNGSVIELSEVQYGMYMIQVANANGSNTFRIVKN